MGPRWPEPAPSPGSSPITRLGSAVPSPTSAHRVPVGWKSALGTEDLWGGFFHPHKAVSFHQMESKEARYWEVELHLDSVGTQSGMWGT